CDLHSNKTAGDVYPNALCASDKLYSYAGECKDDVPCYLTKYNANKDNQVANAINVTGTQFAQVYSAWNSYAWKAS
ncbi:MAG: hypothetical protein AABW99_00135, partial [archaeon]